MLEHGFGYWPYGPRNPNFLLGRQAMGRQEDAAYAMDVNTHDALRRAVQANMPTSAAQIAMQQEGNARLRKKYGTASRLSFDPVNPIGLTNVLRGIAFTTYTAKGDPPKPRPWLGYLFSGLLFAATIAALSTHFIWGV